MAIKTPKRWHQKSKTIVFRLWCLTKIYKYCTKPELEILLILNENLIKEYDKVKSSQSPKTFAKKYIKYNGKKYDQSSEFLSIYYKGTRVENLIKNITDYKKYKKHNKDELYLYDLLKKS